MGKLQSHPSQGDITLPLSSLQLSSFFTWKYVQHPLKVGDLSPPPTNFELSGTTWTSSKGIRCPRWVLGKAMAGISIDFFFPLLDYDFCSQTQFCPCSELCLEITLAGISGSLCQAKKKKRQLRQDIIKYLLKYLLKYLPGIPGTTSHQKITEFILRRLQELGVGSGGRTQGWCASRWNWEKEKSPWIVVTLKGIRGS